MVNMVNGKALSHIQGPGPCPILNLKFHIQLNKNRVWFALCSKMTILRLSNSFDQSFAFNHGAQEN